MCTEDQKLRLRGEDVDSAVREWAKDELKAGPNGRHSLGKFFCGVSIGTIGLLVSIAKLTNAEIAFSWMLVASPLLLLVSVVVALKCAIPPLIHVSPEDDLFDLLKDQTNTVHRFAWSWFALWFFGLLFGCSYLFTDPN